MYAFVRDIRFAEQLMENGFDSTLSVCMVNDRKFFSSDNLKCDGIYSYFRNSDTLHGKVNKPTGNEKFKFVDLKGFYNISWSGNEQIKYYVVAAE